MDQYWIIIALAIGYYYAQKNARKAVADINKHIVEKHNKNHEKDTKNP